MSYEDQLKIQKALLQAQGDETEGTGVDSDVEVTLEEKFNRRLFNYIQIQDRVSIPAQNEDKPRKTLFIEIDGVLAHIYVPDENTGYMTNPANIEPAAKLFEPTLKVNINYYPRPGLEEFLEYISENFEPIIYSKGEKEFVDCIMDQIDPDRKIFRHVLYQNACYRLNKPDEDLSGYVKDIYQFDRDPTQSLLLDTNPVQYILNPDNVIPCIAYQAEEMYEGQTDEFLTVLKEELEEFRAIDDVRVMS